MTVTVLVTVVVSLLSCSGTGAVVVAVFNRRARRAALVLSTAQTNAEEAETAAKRLEVEKGRFDLVERLETYLVTINKERDEKAALHKKVEALDGEARSLKRRVDKLEGDLRLAQDDRTRLLIENTRQAKTNEEQARTIAEQGKTIAEQGKTIAEQENRIAALEAEVSRLRGQP